MRGPLRTFGDRVARRVAFETNRWRLDEPPEEPSPREHYLAMALLRDRPTSSGPLSASELQVFSQNGEDGVLHEILARIGVTERGFFVEFGVQDGVQCNTRYLAEVLGWSGVYLEADGPYFARLEQRLANRPDLTTVEAMVTPENVEQLFRQAQVPTEFDVLSIDVDGQDYWIWQAITSYKPRVVVIEHNSAIDADEPLVEPRGHPPWAALVDFYGASMSAMRALGEHLGYSLVHAELAGVNLFFVRKDLAGAFPDPPLARGPNFNLVGDRHRRYEGTATYVRVSPGREPTNGPDRGE